MQRRIKVFLLLLSLMLAFGGGAGLELKQASVVMAAGESDESMVQAKLLSDCTALIPGKKFKLGVELSMAPGWHTYYRESGEAGMPTKIVWQLPEGFKASELRWQKPHKMSDAGIVTYGYNDSTIIVSEIIPAENLKAGETLKFQAKVKWLACKDACVPGSADLILTLPVVLNEKESQSRDLEKFAKADFNGPVSEIKEDGGAAEAGPKKSEIDVLNGSFKLGGVAQEEKSLSIWVYLLFSLIGGFILNFMPCVLPVISIKIFSLVEQAGEDQKSVFRHGLTFAAGIILSFLSLAGLVVLLQNAGEKIGWGFQFQYPVFVLSMAAVVTLFALSMFGVFYLDFQAGQKSVDKLSSAEGLSGTFFKGVLATILSTPCTAPFLGTALGFAFAQPWWQIMLIFFVIGLGMSLPYLVLALRPDWMKFLPKPGTWMERFKESLGFVLLATSVWLLTVLAGLVDTDAVMAALSFLVAISIAAWIVGSFIDLNSGGKRKALVWSLALLLSAGAYSAFLIPYPELLSTKATKGQSLSTRNSKDGIQWRDFSLELLENELSAGKTVFMDFTAKWCLTCKVNEATIINTPPVIAKIKELNVVAIKADWTAQDAQISELLRKFGRSGVPVYVIFPAGKASEPVVLPETLTQNMLIEALEKAGASKSGAGLQ